MPVLKRAEEVLASLPGVKAYVSEDGEVELTDVYGREIDVEMTGLDGQPIEVFANVLHDPQDLLRYELEQQRAEIALLQQRQTLLRSAAVGTPAVNAPLNQFRIVYDSEE